MAKFYNESEEMYLETILILKDEKAPNKDGEVKIHAIDIANKMSFSRASVSRAMQSLKEHEYIEIHNDDSITLTESGESYAKKIYERHEVLTAHLISLGVDKDIAEEDACKIEHVISDETFLAIKSKI